MIDFKDKIWNAYERIGEEVLEQIRKDYKIGTNFDGDWEEKSVQQEKFVELFLMRKRYGH